MLHGVRTHIGPSGTSPRLHGIDPPRTIHSLRASRPLIPAAIIRSVRAIAVPIVAERRNAFAFACGLVEHAVRAA